MMPTVPDRRDANLAAHAIDPTAMGVVFEGLHLWSPDPRGPEGRRIAVGHAGPLTVVLVYDEAEGGRRILSARKATRAEKRAFQAAFMRTSHALG
ncbi:BrnT family toxin [Marinivivus vitaminiproducens]|uniref:BrnT family toxin n=1 Tax=Marinivivus vitaminiproducens TaxID=3035935 RepID=UPI0027A451C7|nr:BrnT family toxin [Geminicoccaceae bacterium SCSIO 64248]